MGSNLSNATSPLYNGNFNALMNNPTFIMNNQIIHNNLNAASYFDNRKQVNDPKLNVFTRNADY